MKILHIYKDYFPVLGGIENHVKALAEAQAARGHEVSVLVASRDRRTHVEMMNGVRVIFAARLATISSAPISLAMFDLLRPETPDIVHLQFPYPLGELANYFFGCARKTVLSYQSDIVRQKYLRMVYAPFMQRVLARVDRIVASSPNYILSSPVLSQWKSKCTVVPLGIDPNPFIRMADDSFAGLPQGQPSSPVTRHPSLLFVGRLRYYKGLHYLIQAMQELPRAQLMIVGTGPMEREWHALAHKLGVDDRIVFVGEVRDEELPAYYAAADIFVLPASERSEAYGLVQLEAMASGKPVICTELGTGTSFVNVNEETGLVVRPRDVDVLAAAITRLLDNPNLRARMGAAGRARVLQEFTLDKMVDRVMAMYEELLG